MGSILQIVERAGKASEDTFGDWGMKQPQGLQGGEGVRGVCDWMKQGLPCFDL